jgi:tetratricopeptide (TPR) repeat protein
MTCVVSVHSLRGKLAGAGVIVAHDLVLTCAHVVNRALRRADGTQTRPADDCDFEIRFESAPGVTRRARIEAAPDAWSAPPASRAPGADLCILKLREPLPEGVNIGRLADLRFEHGLDVFASGYPADWNDATSVPQLDIAPAKVLGTAGHLWLLRADPGAWAAAIATGRRSAGLVYSGFSGGPVQAGSAVVGLVAEARKDVRQATAYAVPVRHFPARILPLRAGHRAEAWLAAHLKGVADRFGRHMSAAQIKPGVRPEELFLELVVVEKHFQKREKVTSQNHEETYSLQEILDQTGTPILLIGEGGAGKTTSLLYTAARAAERVKADPGAPIPIYVNLAQLTKIEDVPDLLQLIADSVPDVMDWKEIIDLKITEHHRLFFLFDAFNEIPEQQQRIGGLIIQRFIEKHKDHHTCLVGSRPVPQIEQLARPPSQFKTFEIRRLAPDQVHSFLQVVGLGSLYDRMPGELRDLAGNPFMLLAIAQTMAGPSRGALPRNRGRLYQRFLTEWIEKEKQKRLLDYSYERVKEPILAYLAKRMTSAAETSLALGPTQEEEVEHQLEQTQKRFKSRGGIPANPTVDGCLAEIVGDGLLKKVNEQLYFMHQSVQEYFTGLYFLRTPDYLVEFTPKLSWELVPTHEGELLQLYELAKAPNHRFVSALLMMVGLLEDGTRIVEAIAARNPILAAAALSSASSVRGSLIGRLQQSWLDLLGHEEFSHRVVACSCLALASMKSARVIQRLLEFALGPEFKNFRPEFKNLSIGILALKELGAAEIVATELVEIALRLQQHEFEERRSQISGLISELETGSMVRTFFERWRNSSVGTLARSTIECLLASVSASLRLEELQKIRSLAAERAIAADAEQVLNLASAWDSGLIRATLHADQAQSQYADRVAAAVSKIETTNERDLAAGLQSRDPVTRAAAAKFAAQHQIPLGDAILESLLRRDQDLSEDDLIAALVSLWGEDVAVFKLMEGSKERRWCVAVLNSALTPPRTAGMPLSQRLKEEIRRAGVTNRDLRVWSFTGGETSKWLLEPSSWGLYQPLYQLVDSVDGLELEDCNMEPRAFAAIAKIPGEASLVELQGAVEHGDFRVLRMAIDALVERGDQGLAGRLLAQLRFATSPDFIQAALSALRQLRPREALALVNDLLGIRIGEFSKPWQMGWDEGIHKVLVALNADSEIQEILDKTIASDEATPKVAALKELSRWLPDAEWQPDADLLGPERLASWRTPGRLQAIVQLALSDPLESVRAAAVFALGGFKSELVERSLADSLADDALEVRLAAGEALVWTEREAYHKRVTEVMIEIATGKLTQRFRERAGRVLSKIPGGRDPFHQPIQAAFLAAEWDHALELVNTAVEIFPNDATLFWWRGHALRNRGELRTAADNYARAAELEKEAPIIPQALAQTFLELGDVRRALDAARSAVDIDPSDVNSQSILAWCSYKFGNTDLAVKAASIAVDLDPVHGEAIWIILLVHISQRNLGEARVAFEHAVRVRQLLSPGLDTSFIPTFLEELEEIDIDNVEISSLVDEIRNALLSTVTG